LTTKFKNKVKLKRMKKIFGLAWHLLIIKLKQKSLRMILLNA